VDNTVLDKLFTVNPVTGASAPINVAAPGIKPLGRREHGKYRHPSHARPRSIQRDDYHDYHKPLFDDPTTVAKYGDDLALPNGRYNLGLPPPFGPGAPPGTTFNVICSLGRAVFNV
jgi:hypothetical protein